MNSCRVQRAPHRRRARVWGAADGIGQFTGALPTTGGGAKLGPGHRTGAWTGLTEPVMVSTGRAHPGGVLTIADRLPHGGRPLQHQPQRCPHGGGAPRHHPRPPGRQPAQRPSELRPTDYQGPPGYRPARYLQRLLDRHRQGTAGRWPVRHQGTASQQQTRRRPGA